MKKAKEQTEANKTNYSVVENREGKEIVGYVAVPTKEVQDLQNEAQKENKEALQAWKTEKKESSKIATDVAGNTAGLQWVAEKPAGKSVRTFKSGLTKADAESMAASMNEALKAKSESPEVRGKKN